MSEASLDDLLKNSRLSDSLARAGITTLEQLAERSKEEVKELRGIGPSGLRQLEALLEQHSCQFSEQASRFVKNYYLTGAEPEQVKRASHLGKLEGMDMRIRGILWDAGITTLENLVVHTPEQLGSMRGLGHLRVNQIQEALKKIGLQLAQASR